MKRIKVNQKKAKREYTREKLKTKTINTKTPEVMRGGIRLT